MCTDADSTACLGTLTGVGLCEAIGLFNEDAQKPMVSLGWGHGADLVWVEKCIFCRLHSLGNTTQVFASDHIFAHHDLLFCVMQSWEVNLVMGT